MQTRGSTRLRSLFYLFLWLLLFLVLARVAFIWRFGGLRSFLEAGIWKAQYLGLKFDARLCMILLMPAWLLMWPGAAEARRYRPQPASWRKRLAPLGMVACLTVYWVMVGIATVDDHAARPWLLVFLHLLIIQRLFFSHFGLQNKVCARLWFIYSLTCAAFLFLVYAVDFGTYAYIHNRVNGTLLSFVGDTKISLAVVWQSYPVIRILLGMALFVALMGILIKRLFRHLHYPELPPLPLWGVRVGVTLLMFLVMYGKLSQYPLRWSESFEAKKALHAHAGLNPAIFFLETRKDMNGGFDLEKVKATHGILAQYFGCQPTLENGLPSLMRTLPARPEIPGTPNVVFIQLESFAAFKTGLMGTQMNQTPFFDQLAKKGIFFDRFFVPMENTSRSMYCTLAGVPDVSSVENATRNPLILEQRSALHALNNYEKSFHLGGSANWAQIRGIFKHNFPDIKLYEQETYKAPKVDAWGVCDADLLLETNEVLKTKHLPFWAYIQTSGNHPPFTIPTHLKDFQTVSHDQATLAKAGFIGNDEFNALRLMDYSLQKFFEAAEKAPYFNQTVFVLWADHGIPRGYTDTRFGDMALGTYHIPFLIYAPGFIKEGRVVHTVGSQMDLMPTVMSLIGREVQTRTLGKDLLDPQWADKSMAFTFTTFRRPPAYGLIRGNDFFRRESDGSRRALFDLNDPTGADRAHQDKAKADELDALSMGFYEWSRYLLCHNKR